jgi:uncharacterized protein (DUF362 family)
VGKAVVAVVKTAPSRAVEDVGIAMELARYREALPRDHDTHLKINISWHVYYPACSTTPWQLDGVISRMLADGYDAGRIIAAHNSTVVVDSHVGEVNNHLSTVIDKHRLKRVFLDEPPVEWVRYVPKTKMLVLDGVYPEGIMIPKPLIGENVIHLPTMKTHVFTTMTGAMKNAFGGLLHRKRHWTHSVIHETLVDLLAIQRDIHPGIFVVMDATIAGDGPGPRVMRPHVVNYLLAGSDSVAIDAVASKMMGFDPMSIDFIRLAHERGLGCGDLEEIDIAGEDVSSVNLKFEGSVDTFASRGQKMIYHGWLKPLEHLLLRTAIVPWSYAASRLYHDVFWYNLIGKRRVSRILRTEWGELFRSYAPGR